MTMIETRKAIDIDTDDNSEKIEQELLKLAEILLQASKRPAPRTLNQKENEAFSLVYSYLNYDIFVFIRNRYTGCTPFEQEQTSQDLTQQTFYKFFKRLLTGSTFDELTLKNYLFKSAHNVLKNYFRDKKPIVPLDDDFDDFIKSEENLETMFLISESNREITHTLLDALAETRTKNIVYYQILLLKYIDNLSQSEIQAWLNQSLSENDQKTLPATRILIHRAKISLKKVLLLKALASDESNEVRIILDSINNHE